jgi:phage gp36-like protein
MGDELMADYTTPGKVREKFGTSNVNAWADLDNTKDAEAIELTVETNIELVGAYINDYLRPRFTVPFDPVPDSIEQIATLLTGVFLYEGRGIQDSDAEGRPVHKLSIMRKIAEAWLRDIRAGNRALPGITGPISVPGVLKSEEESADGSSSYE